jgi:tetratricopeptide (TPR) repeat protein
MNIAGLIIFLSVNGFWHPVSFAIYNPMAQSQSQPSSSEQTGTEKSSIPGAASENTAAENAERKNDSSYLLRKLEEWREASVNHDPGKADSAATEIGSWRREDLEIVIDFITKLASRSKSSIKRTIAKAPVRSRLGLTDQEVQNGDLNRILKQGALLHTDIALLKLDIGSFVNLSELLGAFIDGQVILQPKRLHWEFARRLIDSIASSPSNDPMARQWYIATTAYMQSLRHLVYARENIESALKTFPSNERILLYAGALHETWASPMNQNIQLPPNGELSYDSPKKELEQAQKLYRKAIAIDPDYTEARLRLGRVQGLLGLHPQSIVELRRADALSRDPQLSYYASLYLGYEFEMMSHPDEARDQYERAATLYPAAQSPLLALSQLAHSNDGIEDAIKTLQRVFSLRLEDPEKDDPLWIYDLSHVRDASALIEEMHRMFGDLPR